MTFKWECSIMPSLPLSNFLSQILWPCELSLIQWKKLIKLKFISANWLSGNTPSGVIKNSKKRVFIVSTWYTVCQGGILQGLFTKKASSSVLQPVQLRMRAMGMQIPAKVTLLFDVSVRRVWSQLLHHWWKTSWHRSDHLWIHRCVSLIILFYDTKNTWAASTLSHAEGPLLKAK